MIFNRQLRRCSTVGLPLLLVAMSLLGQARTKLQEEAERVDQPGRISTTSSFSSASGVRMLPTPVSKEYRIGVDDVLNVNVWHEPDLSRNITVRPDGKISLPLIGEIQAAGKTPTALQSELASDLSQFVKDPELTVIVVDIRSRHINVIGEVMRPGTFALTQQMGVLDAIAEAGGLKQFAKKKKIYVLRETAAGKRTRLKYNYRAVLSGKSGAQDIILQSKDTVVVP